MNKKIIIPFLILAALIALFLVSQKSAPKETLKNFENETATSSQIQTETKTALAKESPKEKAWAVLVEYLDFAKQKNVAGLKTVAYNLSPACKQYDTESLKKECDEKMATVVFLGDTLKKEDFQYVWNDSKQIILATDFKIEENEQAISRSRGIIYFLIDEKGNPKLVNFNHAKGSIAVKGEASQAELLDRLQIYTRDNDEDGKEDYLEECLSKSQDGSCLKTDPKIKDTDKDGYWDGLEIFLVN